MSLPGELVAPLRCRSTCYLATLMPHGSPRLTRTWVDTDGENIMIVSAEALAAGAGNNGGVLDDPVAGNGTPLS